MKKFLLFLFKVLALLLLLLIIIVFIFSSNGDVESPIIYEVVKETELYSEPSVESSKLVNQKSTEYFGELNYLSIDKSCEVCVIDTVDGWSKVKVINPSWFSETHIGWVKNEIIKEKQEVICLFEENKDYQVLYSKKIGTLTNYNILLLRKELNEKELETLSKCIKKEKSPNSDCNISIYDDASIIPLIDKYPLNDKEYVKLADHFVYMLTFDGFTMMYYPLKDSQYEEYEGKNPIR